MNYQIGDRVRVIPNLRVGHHYGLNRRGYCNERMLQYAGQEFVVEGVENPDTDWGLLLRFVGVEWAWYVEGESMVEPVRPTHIHGVKVPPTATHYGAHHLHVYMFKTSPTGKLLVLCPTSRRWRIAKVADYWERHKVAVEDYNKPKPVVTKKYLAKELF